MRVTNLTNRRLTLPRVASVLPLPHTSYLNKTSGKALFESCNVHSQAKSASFTAVSPKILYTIVEVPDLHLDEMAVSLWDETDGVDMRLSALVLDRPGRGLGIGL